MNSNFLNWNAIIQLIIDTLLSFSCLFLYISSGCDFLCPCTKWLKLTLVLIVTLSWSRFVGLAMTKHPVYFLVWRISMYQRLQEELCFSGCRRSLSWPNNYCRVVLVNIFLVDISTSDYNWQSFIESIISNLWVSW